MTKNDREILRAIVIATLFVTGLMFVAAFVLRERDLSLVECWLTGRNDWDCRLR